MIDNFRRQWYRVHWRSKSFPGDYINYFSEGLTGIRTSKIMDLGDADGCADRGAGLFSPDGRTCGRVVIGAVAVAMARPDNAARTVGVEADRSGGGTPRNHRW